MAVKTWRSELLAKPWFKLPPEIAAIPVKIRRCWINKITKTQFSLGMSERPSVYACDKVKARKNHVCYECRGTINAGETYNYHHGVWDGSGACFRVCNECENLRTVVDKTILDPEECTAFGQLTESVFERGELEEMKTFLAIKEKRGGPIAAWMNDRFDSLMNRADEKAETEAEFFDYERDGQESN